MAKQLNVNLNIDAQTGKAKQALTELNKILTDIQTNRTITVNDKSLQEAKQAASDLKFHLAQATSVDTGKLNLGAFSQSLKKAGQDLNTLYNKLSVIGPEGQQAFLALSQSIVQADHASLTLGNRLSQLGTTLKNTARWQLSSTLLHGFMGALQGAYGYAQDLNKSLNNIRIVTGQSIDDMAKFADEANRAARSLSATTTAYTDAALIYYQQGLDDKAVKERTETTIKLANVSRQSAEEVSSQMTAIWNNFDDGSKSLEYYADVITKLGAATAASSSEISDGLQKFAAVADTVGLSYEKATAALATVVAETRQSADVVGTAFKTMFARFQGLELGETLEDGVTLNKYAEAINTVGVNILKANGDLKDMDTILDELGEKWNSIGEAQKVALAETVAGTRQYAQFMAIMNNYDKILANQNIASGAEGTLQQQADIYAESWEAASKRVRAAAQGIYQDLLDDKFFITALNGLEKIIGAVDGAIKSIGGLKTVLLAVGSVIASKYATEMPAIMQKLVGNFNVLTGAAENQRIAMIQDANAIIQSMEAAKAGTKEFQAQVSSMQLMSKMTEDLEKKKKSLSQAEIASYEQKIREVQLYGDIAIAIGKEIDMLDKEAQKKSMQVNSSLFKAGNLSGRGKEILPAESAKKADELRKKLNDLNAQLEKAQKNHKAVTPIREEIAKTKKELDQLNVTVTGSSLSKIFKEQAVQAGKMEAVLSQASSRAKQWAQDLKSGDPKQIAKVKEEVFEYVEAAKKAGFETTALKRDLETSGGVETFVNGLLDGTSKLDEQFYDVNQRIDQLKIDLEELGANPKDLAELEVIMRKNGASSEEFAAALEQIKAKFSELPQHAISLSESLTRVGSLAMSLGMAFNAIKNIGNIFSDDSLSTGEKLLQLLTAIGMLLPAINSVLSEQNLQWARNTVETIKNTFAKKGAAAAATQEAVAEGAATGAKVAGTVATKGLTAALGKLWIAVWPLLAIAGTIAAVAGGIVLVTNAIKDFYATKPEGQLEKSKKATKGLAEAADDAKQSYEDLKSSFDKYDSVVKTLNECREGTEEWNNALKDVNNTVLEIIRNHPELAGKMQTSRDKNGRLVINNVDDLLAEAENKNNNAQNAELIENIRQQQLEIEVAKRSFMNSQNMVAPVKQQILANLSDYYKISPEEFIEKIGGTHGLSKAAFTDFYESVQDLANAAEEAAKSMQNTSELMVENLLGDNYTLKAKEEALDYLHDWEAQERERLLGQNKDINIWSGKNSSDVQNLWKEYSNASKTNYELAGNAILGTDNNRSFQYIDENGENKPISLEEMISAIIADGMEDALKDYIEENVENDGLKKQLSNIIPIKQIQQDIANYNKELRNLKFGDIIQPEVFDKLSTQAQSYFQIMEDGTYKLIGSAEQLQDVLFKEATADFDKNLENYSKMSFKHSEEELDEDELRATSGARSLGKINSHQFMVKDEEGNYQISDDHEQMEANAIAYATATETLEQLEYVKSRFNKHNVDFETAIKAENNALQDLASKYDSCTDDLKDFQHALTTSNPVLIQAAKKTLEYSIRVAELSEKYGFDTKQTEAYAKRLKDLNKDMLDAGYSEEQLEQASLNAAIANQRLDRGISDLKGNLETYKTALTDTNKGSFEWSTTLDTVKTDLADILNMDPSVLRDEFAEDILLNADNADLLQGALDGDIESIRTLQEMAAKELIFSISADLPTEEANEFITLWEKLKDKMAETIDVGELDQSDLIKSFNELIKKGNMTKEQIEATLAGMHVAADIITTYNEQEVEVPSYTTYEDIDELDMGGGHKSVVKTTKTVPGKPVKVTGWVPTYAIKGTTGTGSASIATRTNPIPSQSSPIPGVSSMQDLIDSVNAGKEESQIVSEVSTNAGVPLKTTGFAPVSEDSYTFIRPSESATKDDDDDKKTGGKDSTYKEELLKKEEYRYLNIQNRLKTLQQAYDRVKEARDHAYGTDKFAIMDKEIEMLKDMKEAHKDYIKEIAGDNWESLYNKVKNGEALTLDDLMNSGGNLLTDLQNLTSKIVVNYQIKDDNGNVINTQSGGFSIFDLLGEFGFNELDFDEGFIGNEQEFRTAVQAWKEKQYASINWQNTEEADRLKTLYDTQVAQMIEYFEQLKTTYELLYDQIDEQIDFDYKIQDVRDAFPRQQITIIEDEEHRYDELSKTLEGLVNQYERVGKARERAWGEAKLKLLERESKKLEQLQKTYERYLKTIAGDNWQLLHGVLQAGGNLGNVISSGRAGGNLQKDYDKIVKPLAKAMEYVITDKEGHQQRATQDWKGLKEELKIDLILDEFGQISNSDDIAEALEEWDRKFYAYYESFETAEEGARKRAEHEEDGTIAAHEEMKKYIQKILEQYAQTIGTFVENSDAYMDNLYEQQAKNYEKFRYKIDLKIDISERSLKRIEYAIKVLGDNIYKIPEIMQSWYDKRVVDTMGEVTSQASTWASAFQESTDLYKSGQITQEDYVQTIKDAQDGLYGCIDALLEINEEMREYYKNVLSRVKDDMSRITDEMDHQLDTVKHLQNVLSLLGRDTDYEAIGKILEAQMSMNENAYEVSKAQAEMYRHQVELAEAELAQLAAEGVSEEAQEEWKNAVLYPAKEALLEAEKEMQADFEAYLETVNALYENKINKIYQDSERRLAGAWGSFDQLNNAMERQRALDEEYLTKTNQIYETNVLIRKLAQDIDKTNNESSKLKLKNFSAEIDGLQQKNKLSKSELDIAKARYEVLLAEIALEEARNAKSTVRLQRDNEGNYGYVYTADGDSIAAAEDDLAKKNNDLYNLVLGQANNYTEKIIQLTQERNAALKELDMAWAEGRITDEDAYNKAREDIINKYNSLIEEDYESYYRALYWLDETATTDHTEAWGTSFQDVLDAEEDFKGETDTIIGQTGAAIDWLNGVRAKATDEAKVGNGDLEKQLEDLTNQNDALAKKMIEEVVPNADAVLTKAQELTGEWARQYDQIRDLIQSYLDLIDAMQAVLREMSGLDEELPDETKEEFDITKDYSLEATKAFEKSGYQVTDEVIQALLFRQQKEAELGHNDNNFTNEQLLEMFLRASSEHDAELFDYINQILEGNAFYTVDHADELGITGDGYSLEDFAASIDANTEAQTEGNDLQRQGQEQAADLGDAADERSDNETDAQSDAADKNADSAGEVKDAASDLDEGMKQTEEDFEKAGEERSEYDRETAEETTEKIEGTTENLIIALDRNAEVVSAAVSKAAQIIAYSIMQAEAAADRAEIAADRAESAALSVGDAEGLATGGYTGSWGSAGKLAVLHEKELVLNSDDTTNLLSAIAMLRDFSSAIDLRAAASNISTGLSSPVYEAGSQTLEQSVTIHAEFPNATNHSEIEEAFNNLVNRASQYANRS